MPVAIDMPRRRIFLKGNLRDNYIWLHKAWRYSERLRCYEFPFLIGPVAPSTEVVRGFRIRAISDNWTIEGDL